MFSQYQEIYQIGWSRHWKWVKVHISFNNALGEFSCNAREGHFTQIRIWMNAGWGRSFSDLASTTWYLYHTFSPGSLSSYSLFYLYRWMPLESDHFCLSCPPTSSLLLLSSIVSIKDWELKLTSVIIAVLMYMFLYKFICGYWESAWSLNFVPLGKIKQGESHLYCSKETLSPYGYWAWNIFVKLGGLK